MSDAPESTAVVPPPPAPPAPAPVTVEHIGALHRHLDELKSWVGEKFKELFALVEKAAPVVEKAAAAVATSIPGVGPIVAAVEKAAEVAETVVRACPHAAGSGCSCAKPPAPSSP